MPAELTGWAQWGAVGVLMLLAFLSVLGKGIVGRSFYEEKKADLSRANETNETLLAQNAKLATAIEQNNALLRQVLDRLTERAAHGP